MDWNDPIHNLCINSIRFLSVDAIEKARSGHPGLPMGAAPMAYVLWRKHLKHNPKDHQWPDRDRFVLSAGHGSMLVYALLHLTGYPMSIEDIKRFRQWQSPAPGHPESFVTPGVESTSGPLGQGLANGVGLALAEKAIAARYNKPGHVVCDHITYVLCSDGDLMEGVSGEASSLAGHLGLGKLICLYDDNDVTLDGPASLSFSSEDVAKRYEAYGWQVLRVEDGDSDLAAIDRALEQARQDSDRPSLICVKTTIGFGAPTKAGTSSCHGSPLGAEEAAGAKQALGWTEEPFGVPAQASETMRSATAAGAEAQRQWQQRYQAWAAAYPELAAEWQLALAGKLPEGWDAQIPVWQEGESLATRVASGKVINGFAGTVPWYIGGDADLSCSTKNLMVEEGNFDGRTGEGRNIRYGVREHAMGAIANGIAYHGGLRTSAATFLVFSDYMRPPVRLAAMSKLPVTYIWTHDSIGVGEDGPTHQPIEQYASLRAIPNLVVIRPADPNETAMAWRVAMTSTDAPVALLLTRQGVPAIAPSLAGNLERGAYVLKEPASGSAEVILVASGSEVAPTLAAQQLLEAGGISARVVSMPSWELFERQDQEYRDAVLPPAVRARVSVEAGCTQGWGRWVGLDGCTIGIDRFGASAPGGENMKQFGFTAENIAAQAKALVR